MDFKLWFLGVIVENGILFMLCVAYRLAVWGVWSLC